MAMFECFKQLKLKAYINLILMCSDVCQRKFVLRKIWNHGIKKVEKKQNFLKTAENILLKSSKKTIYENLSILTFRNNCFVLVASLVF